MANILYKNCYKTVGSYNLNRIYWKKCFNRIVTSIGGTYMNEWNGKFHKNSLLPIFIFQNGNKRIRIQQYDPDEVEDTNKLYFRTSDETEIKDSYYITAWLLKHDDDIKELVIVLLLTKDNLEICKLLIKEFLLEEENKLEQEINKIYEKQYKGERK